LRHQARRASPSARGGILSIDGRSLAAVLLAGGLTGSELTSWGIVHPALWRLDHPEQVRAEKLIYKRFGSVDPFLMTATTAASFVAGSALNGRPQTLALSAGGRYATMLAITLLGNMPFNLRVFRWNETNGDPAEWRRLRQRWDRLHNARVLLDTAGFVIITLATLEAGGRPASSRAPFLLMAEVPGRDDQAGTEDDDPRGRRVRDERPGSGRSERARSGWRRRS
jgi:Domain of unknown function (DUF1772)